MIDDLDAAVSPAAFAFPAIDVVVGNQMPVLCILGKEVGEALHGEGILRVILTPFLVCRIQIAGRRFAVFMESEVSFGCQEFQDVIGVLYDGIDVVLRPLTDGKAVIIGNEPLKAFQAP